MSTGAPLASELERRKRVRLRLRPDLAITPQRYEGRTYYVIKDPVSLRYYRFKEQEHFLLGFMDGSHTLDEAQKEYEKRFRPERLNLEDLEAFAQQLISAGLAQNESPRAGKQLLDQRNKRNRSQWMQTLTNVLYIKIPVFDPDRLLVKMLRWLSFVFTVWFFTLSVGVMLAAVLLVATHFDTFRGKLPSYHEFFSLKTVVYLWIALGVVKVIHEFGHGLSCKTFGGEVHEMGLLFLVFSPCMYCNVSDSWTLPNKWKRIIISAAGIYVELIIAALATFIWWNTPNQPFINNLSLSLMVVCSVSTVVFNANPLMRYDGYYVLADWIEIPNLRERANRYLQNLFLEHCLGIEVQPEPYMALWRRWLFVIYAIVSYVYRWVITYFILVFIYSFLKPYKLGVVSGMLAVASLASMLGWPLYRLGKNIHQRGRLPDMKPARVALTVSVFAALLFGFFFVPLPVSRVHAVGLVQVNPDQATAITVSKEFPVTLEKLHIEDGQWVRKGEILAEFSSRTLADKMREARSESAVRENERRSLERQREATTDKSEKAQMDQRVTEALTKHEQAEKQYRYYEQQLRLAQALIAPQDGYVMGAPTKDQVGKLWDPKTPLCTVGNRQSLRVLIGVTPADYHVLQENLREKLTTTHRGLPVTVRVQGLAEERWLGELKKLPEAEAQTIPLALSSKSGGPIAVQPNSQPDKLIPQTQHYLVPIDLAQPDECIQPGTMARVKIHCKHRSCAWWVWRTINDTFNLGLG